jgi:hypothetical protein
MVSFLDIELRFSYIQLTVKRKPGGKQRKQTSTYLSEETGLLDPNKLSPGPYDWI